MTYECTHCGRTDCRKLGDKECEEARKRFFENAHKRIEYLAKMKSRDAAHDEGQPK